jgi:hypothetical protein
VPHLVRIEKLEGRWERIRPVHAVLDDDEWGIWLLLFGFLVDHLLDGSDVVFAPVGDALGFEGIALSLYFVDIGHGAVPEGLS